MPFTIGNHITFRAPFVSAPADRPVTVSTPLRDRLLLDSFGRPTTEAAGPLACRPIASFGRRSAFALTGRDWRDAVARLSDPSGIDVRLEHRASRMPDTAPVLFNLWGDAAAGYFSIEPWVGRQDALASGAGAILLPPPPPRRDLRLAAPNRCQGYGVAISGPRSAQRRVAVLPLAARDRLEIMMPIAHLRLAAIAALLGMTSSPPVAAAAAQPEIESRVKPLLIVDGARFRDLNGNGQLDPYEDWRRPVPERTEDLLRRMTLPEKVGLMLIDTMNAGCLGAIPNGAADLLYVQHMRHFILRNGVAASSRIPPPQKARMLRSFESKSRSPTPAPTDRTIRRLAPIPPSAIRGPAGPGARTIGAWRRARSPASTIA